MNRNRHDLGSAAPGELSDVRERLEAALRTLSEYEAQQGSSGAPRRQILLGNLAGAMQDYLAQMEHSAADERKSNEMIYVVSPEMEQRLAAAQRPIASIWRGN